MNARAYAGVGPITEQRITAHPILKEMPGVTLSDDLLSGNIMATPKNKVRIDDWAAETHESITARLEGAKTSQTQIRLTLGMMAVISTMMLIASYNAYLSYDYYWIVESGRSQMEVGERRADKANSADANDPKPATERVSQVLTEQALKDWAASRTVTISPFG